MNGKRWNVKKENVLCLVFGVFLDAFAVALVTKSDFGISAVSSVAYVLSQAFSDFAFGVWSYLFQFILFIIMCILVKKCSIPYLCSFFVGVIFGYTLDFCRFLIRPLPDSPGFRIGYFIFGTLILMIGVALLMISRLPIMTQDLFTREISECYHIPFKKVKTTFDVSCVTLSIVIAVTMTGGVIGIGAGTVINALIIGKGVDKVKGILLSKKKYKIFFS